MAYNTQAKSTELTGQTDKSAGLTLMSLCSKA